MTYLTPHSDCLFKDAKPHWTKRMTIETDLIERLEACLFEGLNPQDWGIDRNKINANDLAKVIGFAKSERQNNQRLRSALESLCWQWDELFNNVKGGDEGYEARANARNVLQAASICEDRPLEQYREAAILLRTPEAFEVLLEGWISSGDETPAGQLDDALKFVARYFAADQPQGE